MTPNEYLTIIFLALVGIFYSIKLLIDMYKLDKQLKEMEKENQALRVLYLIAKNNQKGL